MSDNPNTPRPSFWVRLREAWPLVTFGIAMSVAIAGTYFDMRMAQAENTTSIQTNQSGIIDLKQQLASKATKFLTDVEIQRIWDDLKEQASSMADLERRVQELGITDERVNAKIELEIEKLRAEIQRASAQQQRALDEQTNVMQQILREVQSD